MNNLNQNLYITYSRQKARDLINKVNPLDKIVTLDIFIVEIYEKSNFQMIIDNTISSSIIYKIIQDNSIEYFSYLESDSKSLDIIFDFILKCRRNSVEVETLLKGKKLIAIKLIDKLYQEYKQENNLADLADIENSVLSSWDTDLLKSYNEVFVDEFAIEDISFIKSKYQEEILEKLAKYPKIRSQTTETKNAKIIKPANQVFDNIDEVKTAIRIARKLLEDGESPEEILIVASDISEYAPLYKLFLDEYEIKGYSSLGTSLSSYFNTKDLKVQIAINNYNTQIQSLELLYKKLGLIFNDTIKANLKASITIQDEKIGIELTEPNQLVGLSKKYKHIIFIGTDINHFPPKISENFLYNYDDEIKHFYANSYFLSSQTQLNELKRLSENLYIITATYSGKRELSPSILLDNNFDETIDLKEIKSISQLAYESQTTPLDMSYLGDIKVEGIQATHLSASQINKYLSCPLSYLYGNKIRLQAPNQSEEGFDVMEQGSLMHLCFELFGRAIKESSNVSIDAEELYNLMYEKSIEAYSAEETTKDRGDENIHHQIFLATLQSGLRDDGQKGLLAKFVDYYIENAEEFSYFQNTEFEKEFALDRDLKPYKLKNKDDKNYFIKGFIDRFDNLATQINIIDYKSKKMTSAIDKEKMTQIETQKDVQLALYILYASQAYPNKEYVSNMLTFKGDNKYYHFANLSSIEGLKNSEHYSKEYEEKLRELIFDTKKSIENGEFDFNNEDEKVCGYCDFRFICHEMVQKKDKNYE